MCAIAGGVGFAFATSPGGGYSPPSVSPAIISPTASTVPTPAQLANAVMGANYSITLPIHLVLLLDDWYLQLPVDDSICSRPGSDLMATAVLTNIKAKMIGELTLATFGPTEFKAILCG
ncbi:MAG: hypothetical protein R3C11_16805 [Planctomycetaceae bacterium]